MAPMFAIDREMTGGAPIRVHLETTPTFNRRGESGVKQRWVAEVGAASDTWSLIGRGRSIKAAIADLGPRAYEMDFDEVAWKTRMVI